MVKNLFHEHKLNLDYFFNKVDCDRVEELLQHLTQCSGKLIFCGVGKSGMIAEKLAMTLLSTGTNALFLNAQNALHGDIALVGKDDIVIFFSKSGQTQELLWLVPFIKSRGAYVVAVVSNGTSSLAMMSDFHIELPFLKELCPFNLAPTTSATLQGIFGDILVVALMKRKGFTKDSYAANHPFGSIGKKLIVMVSDLMLKGNDLPLCSKEDLLVDMLSELSSKRCGCLLVVDKDNKLEGIFTDGDLRRAIEADKFNLFEKRIGEYMTVDFKWVEADVLASEALSMMEEGKAVTVLPVLSGRKVLGLLRLHDIIQAGL
jgi:arabinose-5-phosphate isomerase